MQYLLAKLYISFIFILFPQSGINFDFPAEKTNPKIFPDKMQIQELFNNINIKELPFGVFEMAYTGYFKLKYQNKLSQPNILSIIDFTKSSKEKRLFVIDLDSKKLLFNELVAHGMNTGADYAKNFSNNKHSNQSSLGFFLTGETYEGKNGHSMKLLGLEKDFNDLAYERGIVMHGANYVSEAFIKQNGRLGRSFGCTAVSQDLNARIIDTIKHGSCLFIYYPDKNYIRNSEFLNKSGMPEI